MNSTSYANITDFVVEHSNFIWNLNFHLKIIESSVVHTVRSIGAQSQQLVLDVRGLDIFGVSVDGNVVEFKRVVDLLGGYLEIPVGGFKERFTVKIDYNTTEDSKALQWLSAELTHGGTHPYVYSQCQAIHARSLFPCQDTPAVKATYTAEVTAPRDIEVVMSALKETSIDIGSCRVHKFRQGIPIPSYLIAVAAGNLESRQLGPRSAVWTEPSMVDAAQAEFADVETLLTIAEQLCGPYEWNDRCDLLVMPPTFPYGGMENPGMLFLTPCLLSGDRSQLYVVAHEIAHSWTGNLVTNASWDDFWVNEGHTNYLERLILERWHNSAAYRHFHIATGLAELEESLDMFGRDHEYTQLVPRLVGVDPDDCFSRVPYEKGSFLLFFLETLVGKEKMMRWLKKYISIYRLKSLTTDEWKRFFLDYMCRTEAVDPSVFEPVDWQAWFYHRGSMVISPMELLDQSISAECADLAHLWMSVANEPFTVGSNDEERLLAPYQRFLPEQRYYMFQLLNDVEKAIISRPALELMGRLYGLTDTSNTELLFGWSLLSLRSHYADPIDQIVRFLNSQGRLKYNKPIYKAMYDWDVTRPIAIENFLRRQSLMHPVTREEVRKILFPPSPPSSH